MPDTHDPFARFDPEVPVPLSPADIRRRGDRRRRRTTALAVVGGVAAVAIIATPLALLGGGGDDSSLPVASPSASDTAPPPSESTTTTVETGPAHLVTIPDDFPLDSQLPATNERDGTPVTVSDEPAISRLEHCDPLWTPRGPAARTTDVAGVTYTGIEDTRTRTLAVYESPDDASAALEVIRAGLLACPVASSDGGESVYEEVSREGGSGSDEEASVYTLRFRTDGSFDTGLEVLQLVREANALLIATYYGEGGGSAETIASAVDRAGSESTEVIAEMGDSFSTDGSSASGSDGGSDGGSGGGSDGGSGGESNGPATSMIPPTFPIGQGLTASTGDGGRQDGPSPDAEGISFPDGFCGTWPPSDVSGRLAVTVTGPEYRESRELLDLGSRQAAARLVEGLRDAVVTCPELNPDQPDRHLSFVELPMNLPQPEVVLAYTYEQGLGGSIYEVVQVGQFVLATEQVGEWDSSSVALGAVALGESNADVVADVRCDLDGHC